MPTVKIKATPERLREIARPITDAINAAQDRGFTIDEVLVAMMYMLGAAIKQRGATLNLEAPLKDALPPIVCGYNDALSDLSALYRRSGLARGGAAD